MRFSSSTRFSGRSSILGLLAGATLLASPVAALAQADTTPVAAPVTAPAATPVAAPSATAPATGFHPIANVKHHWDKMEARRAFHKLSVHGEMAMVSLLEAQNFLTQNKLDNAARSLETASHHFTAADHARQKFSAALTKLSLDTHHPLPSNVNTNDAINWIPVGGEFIANETLAPEKQANLDKANAQLKAGQHQQAMQSIQVVESNIDFVIALAPLKQIQGAINRAVIFAKSGNQASTQAAVTDALGSIVFVSDEIVSSDSAKKQSSGKTARKAK